MRAVVAVLMAVFFGFYTSSAMAICENPMPELLWMSPAKNAEDVPINAALIVGVAPGVPVAAFLDELSYGAPQDAQVILMSADIDRMTGLDG